MYIVRRRRPGDGPFNSIKPSDRAIVPAAGIIPETAEILRNFAGPPTISRRTYVFYHQRFIIVRSVNRPGRLITYNNRRLSPGSVITAVTQPACANAYLNVLRLTVIAVSYEWYVLNGKHDVFCYEIRQFTRSVKIPSDA